MARTDAVIDRARDAAAEAMDDWWVPKSKQVRRAMSVVAVLREREKEEEQR